MMNRRKFIILTGMGTGSVVIPASIFFVSGTVKKYASLLINKQLVYLKLERGSVDKYVNDYFKDNNDIVFKVKWKAMYYLNLNWEDSDQLLELIKYYLLSSDFFINKMDENKIVRYLGLYNPYKSPVPNPFSYTLYPPEQVDNP